MGKRVPLKDQRKHLTVQEKQVKVLEEQAVFVGNEQLEHPPDWLINNAAKDEWVRLVNEFNKKSMISNLDYNNLGAYCNAFAKYTDIVERLGIDVMIGPNVNPLVQMELKYADEMRKFASLIGLTAESRLKLGSVIAGVAANEVESEFGDV